MKVTYIATGNRSYYHTLWNIHALTQIDLNNAGIKDTCKEIKNKLNVTDTADIDPVRLTYINKLLDYLTGFWIFDNSLKKDKRKIAYVALLELLDDKIEVIDTQHRVMYASQVVRLQHAKRRDFQGQIELTYDVKGTGALEKSVGLSKEADSAHRGDLPAIPTGSPYSYEKLTVFEQDLKTDVPGWYSMGVSNVATATLTYG